MNIPDSYQSRIESDKNKVFTNRFDSIADDLMSKFKEHNPEARWLYYKIAKKLPKPVIDRLAATALERGQRPGAYFNHIAHKEIERAV